MTTENEALYSLMMKAIRSKHSRGNALGYFKLPMIFTDSRLYGGAIGQFFVLTQGLETAMESKIKEGSEMVNFLKDSLGLGDLAPGYQSDLEQLFGDDWNKSVDEAKTQATELYLQKLKNASETEICSAAFILYGALVVGGGKKTQLKVKKVIKKCDHVLFNVNDDMSVVRKDFKKAFNSLGDKYPEHIDAFIKNAELFMTRNNQVVLSIRCLPMWVNKVNLSIFAVVTAVSIPFAMKKR